jgi:predicted short-subunit dehydrogenase-like oxidoreductase (DUF2520 family)
MERYNVSFTGAGKVAGALVKVLHNTGFPIQRIVSKNSENGRRLADFCRAEWSDELSFPASTNIIIVAVPDKQLKVVLKNLNCSPETLVVHTAGSLGLEVFPVSIKRKGVWYPLQTFSKERNIEFPDLPFFLEASDNKSLEVLKFLTGAIGGKAWEINASQRKILHVAAVFVNNFTNHMLTTGKEIALSAGLPFDVFEPLIKETFSKALELGPEKSQTGPAIRNDFNTIDNHLNLLSFSTETKNIYKEVTQSIIHYYKGIEK